MINVNSTEERQAYIDILSKSQRGFLIRALIAFTVSHEAAQDYTSGVSYTPGSPTPTLLDQEVALNKSIRLTEFAMDKGIVDEED